MEKVITKLEEFEKEISTSFQELKKSQTTNFRILLFSICFLGLLTIIA